MPVLEKVVMAAIVALPLGYVCSKQANALIRNSLVVCLWTIFLGIPYLEGMPIRQFLTMITCVSSFIIPLKLTQLVLYPTTSRGDPSVTSKKMDSMDSDLNLQEFLAFVGSFLYYVVPISEAKVPRPTWPMLLKRNATSLVVVVAKIAIVPLIGTALEQLADKYPYPSLAEHCVAYMQMVVLFTMEVIALSWSTDIQSVAISLLSGGRLEMLYMHKYPFLSHSLKDLWGRRYNLLINSLLKETVYIPAQTYYGCSKHVASLAAFVTSGIIHSWVAHFTFGGGALRALCFFVLQAIWMSVVESQAWYRTSVPAIAGAILTISYFYATAWLYVGLFVEAMPEWLDNNPQTVPDLPFVTNVTSSLGSSLGLTQEMYV